VNGDTIKTLLRRLCERGRCLRKTEIYYYRPLVSSEEYGKYSTKAIITTLFPEAQGT
jgi:predicted transcriptional regulator